MALVLKVPKKNTPEKLNISLVRLAASQPTVDASFLMRRDMEGKYRWTNITAGILG